MILAYLDDSGTHQGSPVVVYGGLIALDSVWLALETDWRALLKKYEIKMFHLSHCNALDQEFQNWTRAKSDLATRDFRQAILDRPIWGISCTVVQADWDQLVTGTSRLRLGDADEFCAHMCIHDALSFNDVAGKETKVAAVFDNRENRRSAIIEKIQHLLMRGLYGKELCSVTFANMLDTPALQAADMIATETYWYAQDWIAAGCPPEAPQRVHFKRFLEAGKLVGGIATRPAIERIVKVDSKLASCIF